MNKKMACNMNNSQKLFTSLIILAAQLLPGP